MATDGPRGGDDEREWQDRDTEPIPRARAERPRPDPSSDPPRAEPDPPSADGASPSDPAGTGSASPADERADGPGPGAHHARDVAFSNDETQDHGRLDDDFAELDEPAAYRRDRPRPYPDEPGYPDDSTIYPDDYGDDFVEGPPGSQYVGASTVGASFVVGEPITERITEEELGGLRGGATPLVTSRRVVPLEDEPSTLVQRYLFPTEKFRGEWRRHPIELAKEFGIAVGTTVAMGLLAGYLARVNAAEEITVFLVIGWIVVLLWVAWQIGDWWYDRFILTNKRVMVVAGIITRNVAMMPLQRVTDMKYVQSALGRMLNY
jgi:hypothetical protein